MQFRFGSCASCWGSAEWKSGLRARLVQVSRHEGRCAIGLQRAGACYLVGRLVGSSDVLEIGKCRLALQQLLVPNDSCTPRSER